MSRTQPFTPQDSHSRVERTGCRADSSTWSTSGGGVGLGSSAASAGKQVHAASATPPRNVLVNIIYIVVKSATSNPALTARAVGVPPSPFERQPPGARRNELMDGVGPPRAGRIEANRWRRLEERGRDLPEAVDSLGRREQRGGAGRRRQEP